MLLLGCQALPALAQVYSYKDSEGNTVFTDQPRSGAKKIELAPSNRIMATPPAPRPRPARQVAPVSVHPYQLLRVLVPLPDAGVREDNGAMIVTLTSDPALLPGHFYRVLIDGQPFGKPDRSPVVALENIDRGTHQLAAEIVDAQGRVLERTAAQPFHLQRISLAMKRRMRPCQEDDYGLRPECPLADKPEEE
jgi:hypothetical protein